MIDQPKWWVYRDRDNGPGIIPDLTLVASKPVAANTAEEAATQCANPSGPTYQKFYCIQVGLLQTVNIQKRILFEAQLPSIEDKDRSL